MLLNQRATLSKLCRHKNRDPKTISTQKGRNPKLGDNPDPELLIGSGYLDLD